MRALRHIFTLVAAMTLAAVAVTGYSKPKGKSRPEAWSERTAQRKADLYFMEAQRQNLLGNDDAFFDIMSQAWELDSTDSGVGQLLGYYMLALGQNDTTYAHKGYMMMRRRFDENPADYYSSVFYGMINDRLGNVGESNRVWRKLHELNPDNSDISLKFAEALMASRDSAALRESIGVLDAIERVEGHDLGITSHKVRALLQLKDSTEALAQLRAFRLASPRNADILIYSGDVFGALSQPDSAIYYYDQACRVDSGYGLAYYKRAQYYKQTGDSAAYRREITQALGQESLDVEVKAELLKAYTLDIYNDTADNPEIEELFDRVIQQHPHEGSVRDLYSSYLVARRHFDRAAEQQEIALDANPADSVRWMTVMSLYSQADRPQKAIAIGERALHYFPDNVNMNLMQGGNYQMTGDYTRAMEYFDKVLATLRAEGPGADEQAMSQVLAAIGDSYHSLGNRDSAFTYYEEALRVNPDNVLALNNYAYYMVLSGDAAMLDRAEEYSARSLAAQPDNDTFLDTYAWILFNKKQYDKAREYIDRAIELESDNPQPDVLSHAGDIYYMNGEPARAVEFWQQALELDPDNALLRKKVQHRTHFFE